jgi:hypothetical protein
MANPEIVELTALRFVESFPFFAPTVETFGVTKSSAGSLVHAFESKLS